MQVEGFPITQQNILLCINKIDLSDCFDDIVFKCRDILVAKGLRFNNIIAFSAISGTNISQLEQSLADTLNGLLPEEEPMITQARHRKLLEIATIHLNASLSPLPIEIRCEELRLAAQSIGKISGVILPDELLGEIFSKFCIGK